MNWNIKCFIFYRPKIVFLRDQHNLLSHPAEGEGSSAIGKVGGKESASPCDCTLSIQWYWRIVRLFAIVDFKSKILGKLTMPLVFALMINALNLLTSFPNLQVADRQQPQAYPGTLDDLKFVWFTRYLRVLHLLQWKNNSNLGVNQYNLIWGQNSHKSTLSTDRKVASSICNVSTQRKVSNIGLKVCNDQVCRLCRICML